MCTLRAFSAFDLLRFNNVNLDPLTETYNMSFYMQYLARWPQYCKAVVAPNARIAGYILGKSEGDGAEWHGHVTAITVAPEFRRLGTSTMLMSLLERISEREDCWFVDLFVRRSNDVAIDFYRSLGYSTYRHIVGYYSGDEDAYDMRKPLSRDVDQKSAIPLNPLRIHADDL